MVAGHGGDHVGIQWLYEAHVDDRGIEFIRGLQCSRDAAAKGQNGDLLAATTDFSLADGQGFQCLCRGTPGPVPRG